MYAVQRGGNLMVEVLVATSAWCPTCPATLRQWLDLANTYALTVREIAVGTREGRELAVRLYIRSVPCAIINQQVVHVGTVDRKTAAELLERLGIPRRA